MLENKEFSNNGINKLEPAQEKVSDLLKAQNFEELYELIKSWGNDKIAINGQEYAPETLIEIINKAKDSADCSEVPEGIRKKVQEVLAWEELAA